MFRHCPGSPATIAGEEDGLTLNGLDLAAAFLAVVAIVGWLNSRVTRMPTAVAMVLAGSACALLLLALRRFGWASQEAEAVLHAVREVDFQIAVLGYLLAFLLFAGAMHVELADLRRRITAVASLATLGVIVSTALVGGGLWAAARLLHVDLPFAWALAFGALICPTDPIAVLATVRNGRFSKNLKSILLGEALFNDGVGIVVFRAAVSFAVAQDAPDGLTLIGRVAMEAAGGLALGIAAGALTVRALRAIDDYAVEVSATLALAMTTYAIADALHLSGPIAVVGAGLLVGEHGLETAMSDETRRYVGAFWTLVDDLLSAALFLLLGLELAVAPLRPEYAGLAVAGVVLVTVARWLTVAPWGLYYTRRRGEKAATTVLAWGGVHGAISLALALSLPQGAARPILLTVAFAVVFSSVVVQGLTFPRLARKLAPPGDPDD